MKSRKLLPTPPTPERKNVKKARQDQDVGEGDLKHMQATFRTVGYQRREQDQNNPKEKESSVFMSMSRSKLTDGKKSLVAFVEDNYVIPHNFETATKFGPHSGLCYEDRLVSSYEWQMLEPRKPFASTHGDGKRWKMCWKCSEQGSHLAREGCPKEV